MRIPGTLRIARPDYSFAIESLERSSQILAPPEGLLNREERDSEMNGSEQECCCSAITGCESRIWRRFGKTAIKNDFIFLHAVKMGRDLVATLSRVKTAFDCLPVPARCSQKSPASTSFGVELGAGHGHFKIRRPQPAGICRDDQVCKRPGDRLRRHALASERLREVGSTIEDCANILGDSPKW